MNKAILFGSYAKGTFHENSDIDVAIFSENFEGQKFVESTSYLLGLARKYTEFCIEPVGFTHLDLLEDNPFIKEIIREGREINV